MTGRRLSASRWWGWVVMVVLTALALRLRSSNFGYLAWDDDVWIADPARDDGWWTVWTTALDGVWYPLVRLSFLAEAAVGGGPMLSHGLNLALFAVIVLLAAWLVRDVCGPSVGPLLGLAVWATSPRLVEAVTWVSARKELLSVGLVLAAAVAMRRDWRFGAALGLLLAGMAKPPVALIGLTMIWWHREGLGRRGAWALVAAACAPVLVALSVLGTEAGHWIASGSVAEVVGQVLGLQAHWLAQLQPFTPSAAVYPEAGQGMAWRLAGAVLIGASVWLGARHRAVAVVASLWLASTLPYSGVIEMAFDGADRHLLSASLWVWVGVGTAVEGLGPVGRRLGGLGLLAAFVVSSWRTPQRTDAWQGDIQLWEADRALGWPTWVRPFKLGMAYARAGRFGEAAGALGTAHRLKPSDDAVAARYILAAVVSRGGDPFRTGLASLLEPAPDDAERWSAVARILAGLDAPEAGIARDHCRRRFGVDCMID